MIRIISGKHKRRHLNAPPGGYVRPTSDRTRTALFNVLGLWIQEKKVLDLFAGSGSVGYESISRGADHVTFVERNPTAVKFIMDNAKQLGERENIEICAKDVFKFLNSVSRTSQCEQSVEKQKTEDGGRKAEDGEQKTEDGKQRTEDGEQKTEDGEQKTEDGKQRTEDVGQKTEIQNPKFKIQNYYDFIYADPPFKDADIILLLEKISLSKIVHKDSIIVIEHEKKKEVIEGELYSGFECYKNSKYGKALLSYFKLKI